MTKIPAIAKNVTDVRRNNGRNPIAKQGSSFTCEVNIDGTQRNVTVVFHDDNGTYEVDRPKTVNVASPRGSCLDVKANNPAVDCDDAEFVMNCAMEGADQWITCTGGNVRRCTAGTDPF